ncbi:BamA/OMP85 family outer membrane protein [Flaviaesturariibacter amylovorans]|uniref:POTRA domain-containing protein n=1 Tax=Flaviaesturariibacter amylovorans TaxID=1084520 RepID=A0ABP8HPX2_9BACT
MRQICSRFFFVLLCSCALVSTVSAQDSTRVTGVDPTLQGIEDGRPKEYTIGSIRVTGANHLDTAIVASISGLQVGDKVQIPGSDAFAKAIQNLWRQRLFSNVQIYIARIEGDVIHLELNVQERPRLSNYSFQGVRKTEGEDLKEKVGLSRSTIITENTRRNAIEAIRKFFAGKGYRNVRVRLEEKPDPGTANSNNLIFHITKGPKVKVNSVNFYGNEAATDLRLKKELKGTKEMMRLSVHPTTPITPFGANERITFKEYVKDYGFLSLTKTRAFLDPFVRVKLGGAKYDQNKFDEDREKILDYYNALGYRDARITDTAVVNRPDGNVDISIKVDEGRRYYFGNLVFRGNTKYSDSLLRAVVRINKGDIYNLDVLNKRLGKNLSAEGGADISGLYMDDGYLFFRADPVETAVYNDTIDHEIRIVEGPQATIRNVNIYGNDKTKDYVIRRELRTVPGEKFSRSDLIRSQRELAQLQYFNQEKINPGVVPDQSDGTVDINWQLEEKSSDQLELSAGWGGGIGLTGTLGVTFNNFSIKNFFKKSTWDPLPSGDGQKLSLRIQSNGSAYRSYNFSFTEPWLGGRKRNPFTISFFNSKFANLYNPVTGAFDKGLAKEQYLRTIGVGISLGKQLKWPDDYFSLLYSLNYTQYKLKNYAFQGFGFTTGTSNNISLKIALQRSSVFDPQYPTGGSNMTASVQFTPPYSLIDKSIVTSAYPYKNPEYHKWRFNAEWFVPIGRAGGADRNRQLVLKIAAKYGFMGRYNRKLDFSPFERFQLGGDGLTNSFGILGFDVIALRGYPVFDKPNPSINPDISGVSEYFTIFNKYQLELRYPIVRNPSSTIYALTFFDAANGWRNFGEYNPFRLRRSVGAGMRFFLPMFGMLGFDYGIGLDRLSPADRSLKNASRFTFMLGFEPE